MDYISLGYFGLFVASFLAATILPMSSEGILLLMLSTNYDPLTCLLVATIGNSIGGITNYGIGILGKPSWLERFGVEEQKLLSFESKVKRYGYLLAFFSWVPFIGDPLTIALGFFRVSFIRVLICLVLGKFLRYLAIVAYYL